MKHTRNVLFVVLGITPGLVNCDDSNGLTTKSQWVGPLATQSLRRASPRLRRGLNMFENVQTSAGHGIEEDDTDADRRKAGKSASKTNGRGCRRCAGDEKKGTSKSSKSDYGRTSPTTDFDWWLGLWHGIDPLDGGQMTVSITPADDGIGDGTNLVNIRFSDTFVRACTTRPDLVPANLTPAGSPYSRRGIYLADAEIPEDNGDSFAFQQEVYCFDESEVPVRPQNLVLVSTYTNNFKRDGETIFMTRPPSDLNPRGGFVRFYRESTKFDTFGGLYKGVEPMDGGIITLDIGEVEPGKFELRGSDTFIRACTFRPSITLPEGFIGSGPSWSKTGIYIGPEAYAAEDEGIDMLVTVDGNTTIPVDIYCFANSTDDQDEFQPMVRYNASVAWSFRKAGDIVIMDGTLFGGYPESRPGGYLNMRFHRVSVEK